MVSSWQSIATKQAHLATSHMKIYNECENKY